jgi:hypothetical protein
MKGIGRATPKVSAAPDWSTLRLFQLVILILPLSPWS